MGLLILRSSASVGDFTTSFAATENPISESGKWLNGGTDGLDWTDCQTSNGKLAATSIELAPPPYNDSIACLKTSYRSFNANQFAEGTIYRATNYTFGHEALLFVRMAISANVARGYELYASTTGGLVLVRWNGDLNDFTPLVSENPGILSSGDVVRLEASGSTLTAKINGVEEFTWTDSTWSDGNPGIGNNPWQDGSDFFSFGWEDYTAGDL